ncbi:Hypothetical_protein [Hexamita inflata]|uniref:Hypothetical_protein n=1 Tax=Hexamita inflata TaxID=28002 RepID=A0AA86V3S7_9EUKA|nr:Hypothetical protein HINF_LOCUS62971 [Hexamita inflata]
MFFFNWHCLMMVAFAQIIYPLSFSKLPFEETLRQIGAFQWSFDLMTFRLGAFSLSTSECPQLRFVRRLFFDILRRFNFLTYFSLFFSFSRWVFGIVCLLSDFLVVIRFYFVSLNLSITAAAVSNQLFNSLYNLAIFSLRDQIFLSLPFALESLLSGHKRVEPVLKVETQSFVCAVSRK